MDKPRSAARACAESDDDAVLELDLPFWTEPEDVAVAITGQALRIAVRGALELRRAYWRNRRAPRGGAERARGGRTATSTRLAARAAWHVG
jgi:HSP20 family molecular chaperone IbpA